MKFCLFVLFLTMTVFCIETKYKAHFTLDMRKLNYHVDAMAYLDLPIADPTFEIGADAEGTFAGTIADDKGVKHQFKGNMKIADPPMTHLDKIQVKGEYQSPKTTCTGVFSIRAGDILKDKIPMKGNLKFSDGKFDDVVGIMEKPIPQELSE